MLNLHYALCEGVTRKIPLQFCTIYLLYKYCCHWFKTKSRISVARGSFDRGGPEVELQNWLVLSPLT